MNKFNALHGKELYDPPREWNIKPREVHFKFRTYPPKISPMVSAIMRRLNCHAIDNEYVEVHPSKFPVEYNSGSVTDPDTSLIKSVDDDKMDHLL